VSWTSKLLVAAMYLFGPSAASFAAAVVPPLPDRIIVIGDIHGDYDRYKLILLEAGLIDKSLRWTGRQSKLVQLGDITDRGPHSRKIIDLLMKLEQRAPRDGGQVHVLLGNHEVMNIEGDLRYVHEGEYEAFVTSRSSRVRSDYYKRYIDYLKRSSQDGLIAFDEPFKSKWYDEHPLGWVEHRRAWRLSGEYGEWASQKPAVLKLGSFLFVHAGIGRAYMDLSATDINTLVQADLSPDSDDKTGIVNASDGPLWYRGLAKNVEEEESPHVEDLLAKHQVEHIVIGHTPLSSAIVPRFNAKVIVADVGLSEAYGGAHAYLEILDGEVFAIHRGQRFALPLEGGQVLQDYFSAVRALEPEPSRIDSYVNQIFPNGDQP